MGEALWEPDSEGVAVPVLPAANCDDWAVWESEQRVPGGHHDGPNRHLLALSPASLWQSEWGRP